MASRRLKSISSQWGYPGERLSHSVCQKVPESPSIAYRGGSFEDALSASGVSVVGLRVDRDRNVAQFGALEAAVREALAAPPELTQP